MNKYKSVSTLEKLSRFNVLPDEKILFSEKYRDFENFLKLTISGEGMIGDNNYLMLWRKSEIEELNNDYDSREFLSNAILIGSDGDDVAYGIDVNGRFIEVPFIGMDDEEVKIIANNFDDFIKYVWDNK